jgi:2-dehydropantoate 2-reductase
LKPIEKIAIIGAGALGSFYASQFYKMDKESVKMIAGGDRYARLKEKGILVNGKLYAIPLVRPEDRVDAVELMIVAVKNQHLTQAIQDMRHMVGEHTILLSVMNGVDSEEQLGAEYGGEKIIYAVALGIDAVREDNHTRFSTQGRLLFGEVNNEILSPRVKALQSLFDRAGIVHETPEDMLRVLWWKYMINVGINQVSAVLDAPYGVFKRYPEAMEVMDSAMREVMAIAEAKGIILTEEDIKNWHEVLLNLSPDGKTSMLQDVEAKRKTEVEMFAGRVIEIGRSHGIPTPINETLFRLIKVIEGYTL